MPTIRPYQPKDQENLRHICIETGPASAMQKGRAQTMLLATYCDYYAECEPETCFVIADDGDEAVGYILCAPDYKAYRARFLKDYAPQVKGLPYKIACQGAARMPKRFSKEYPAHLHIDILPDYQRMGLGSQLMDTLTARLREMGIPGVMLGVGAGNVKGRSFYNKYGFQTLMRIPTSVVMGLKL